MIATRKKVSPEFIADMTKHLIGIADTQNAKYPQYKGKFDNYVLGVMTANSRGKMGLSLVKGEYVILNPDIREENGHTIATVYSERNRVNTLIDAKKVRKV